MFYVHSLCQWMFNTQLWSTGSASGGWFTINDKAVCKLHLNIPCKAHQERVKLHHNDAACSSSPPSNQWHFKYKELFSHCSTPTPRTMTHPLWPTKKTKHFAVLKPQRWNQLSLHVSTAKVTSKYSESSFKPDQLTCFQNISFSLAKVSFSYSLINQCFLVSNINPIIYRDCFKTNIT